MKKLIRKILDYLKIERTLRGYKRNGTGQFTHVEIETINRCNGKCEFCPVNVNQPQRPLAKMPDDLYKKIIDELADIDYKDDLALFSNNEPFLDTKIISRIEYARRKLPSAYILIYTNGSLLNKQMLNQALDCLDLLVIDIYDKTSLPSIIKDIEGATEDLYRDKIQINYLPYNTVRTNRGGEAPNLKGLNNKTLRTKCNLPFEQMIIRPDGKVSLCCNDALGKWTMGDVSKAGLIEIWNNDKFAAVRNHLIEKGRKGLPLCNVCDTVNTTHCKWRFRHWF